MKNLSTSSITQCWLLRFEPGGKLLTVGARAKSLVWSGFWRVADVEKLRKALEKKALSFRGTKARKAECVKRAASFFLASGIDLNAHGVASVL